MGEKHKKNKYLARICNEDCNAERMGSISIEKVDLLKQPKKQRRTDTFKEMQLRKGDNPGIFFGCVGQYDDTYYIGMPQGWEGNIVVVGGNGSGKSAGIAIPTLETWREPICATDIKGELSSHYARLFQSGAVKRPYIIFDPMQTDGPSYDPFWWLLQDDESNLVSNIEEIVHAIIPILPDDKQPFWVETERGMFSAALLYYFKLGLSFSEVICKIMETTLSSLCEKLAECEDRQIKIFLGNAADQKADVLAAVDRGLRNKLALFAADPHISHAFRGAHEGAKCFTWDDLNKYNIFLRIPANKIEQWGGAVNLMYTQLIRHLERRPEQHSAAGKDNLQTLLLLDEFARFGKLEMITNALSTLRSKNVNICLMIQSVAQIDKIYGECERRIIFDNCQYQAILRATDAETQEYLCKLIGTRLQRRYSVSEHFDESMKNCTGYSTQVSEVRDWAVYPHELSTLEEVLLLTPQGFYRVKKFQPYNDSEDYALPATTTKVRQTGALPSIDIPPNLSNMNEGAKMLTIEERSQNADKRITAAEHQQRVARKQAQDEQRRKNQRRNFIIGSLVTKYFPEVCKIEPGQTQEEDKVRFEPVEAFLTVLSSNRELIQELQNQAAQMCLGTTDRRGQVPPEGPDM